MPMPLRMKWVPGCKTPAYCSSLMLVVPSRSIFCSSAVVIHCTCVVVMEVALYPRLAPQ